MATSIGSPRDLSMDAGGRRLWSGRRGALAIVVVCTVLWFGIGYAIF